MFIDSDCEYLHHVNQHRLFKGKVSIGDSESVYVDTERHRSKVRPGNIYNRERMLKIQMLREQNALRI